MEQWTIYYNPKCGTCRKVREAVEKRGAQPRLVEYLKNPPTAEELDEVLKKANLTPEQIVRKKEPLCAELRLDQKTLNRGEWLEILTKNPILIERPLVVRGDKAVLARPPEKVQELF